MERTQVLVERECRVMQRRDTLLLEWLLLAHYPEAGIAKRVSLLPNNRLSFISSETKPPHEPKDTL